MSITDFVLHIWFSMFAFIAFLGALKCSHFMPRDDSQRGWGHYALPLFVVCEIVLQTPLTVFKQSIWNFAQMLQVYWRCANENKIEKFGIFDLEILEDMHQLCFKN